MAMEGDDEPMMIMVDSVTKGSGGAIRGGNIFGISTTTSDERAILATFLSEDVAIFWQRIVGGDGYND